MSQKFPIRVRTLDGKPRSKKERNQLKTKLGTYFNFESTDKENELVIWANAEKHITALRGKLADAGLEEIAGGDTNYEPARPKTDRPGAKAVRGGQQRPSGNDTGRSQLERKPYGFVPLPATFSTQSPIWHDGSSSKGKLSGEVRFELETLSPLLVGWEQEQVGGNRSDWPKPGEDPLLQKLPDKKPVACPLRAPWGDRPVIIPGSSLKGLLRHELGALLGAPMERVAERSYSYRPNALFPKEQNPRLIARIARVPQGGVKMQPLDARIQVRVPVKLELLPSDLRYDKRRERHTDYYRFDDRGGAPYRGGQGAGEMLNSKRKLHRSLTVDPDETTETVRVPPTVQESFLSTVRHLTDREHGHFSMRHPDVPGTIKGEDAGKRILQAARQDIFQPGDLIWVEWDTQKKCIVSLGWHYYYRWAYTDTVRLKGGTLERHGLFPLPAELEKDTEGAPVNLSAARRLFGYTGDNEGSKGIGKDDHSQLMGRVFINAGLEVLSPGESEADRFLKPTFLKELGMPRPSAVEHYLQQPDYPAPKGRPDQAKLLTYGDAQGYDQPGELAGRKFYLDRKNASAEDPSEANKQNERSTLALEASKPGRKFRFTVRFRDLDPTEVAALLVALAPHQFKELLGGNHVDGYCSKLGYARPLGWGSVRMEAKQLLLMDDTGELPKLNAQADLHAWAKAHYRPTTMQQEWLAIHRRNHPEAADYPRPAQPDRKGERNIFTYHTELRAEHSRQRRYRNPHNR